MSYFLLLYTATSWWHCFC